MGEIIETIANFFTSLIEYISDAIDYVINFFIDLPAYIFDLFANGIINFFNVFPVPAFFNNLPSVFNAIPPEVVYFAQPFNLGYGLTVILSAYLLRFIIRRIPLIG